MGLHAGGSEPPAVMGRSRAIKPCVATLSTSSPMQYSETPAISPSVHASRGNSLQLSALKGEQNSGKANGGHEPGEGRAQFGGTPSTDFAAGPRIRAGGVELGVEAKKTGRALARHESDRPGLAAKEFDEEPEVAPGTDSIEDDDEEQASAERCGIQSPRCRVDTNGHVRQNPVPAQIWPSICATTSSPMCSCSTIIVAEQ